ncbi:MAG TPA: Holliday junction resolvase RuvX [Alphaproteobacteria bacterium]|nr:Holliday junction resolvase RuvX [Alphaproteobacteria bacterium]
MELKEFKQSLKPYGALIGFDFGTKRLGVAVSDMMRMVATSYKIIERTSFQKDVEEIKRIIKEKEICGIVYGLPKQMDGTEGETAEQTRKFALKIANEVNLPYAFWDERLSSKAVESFLINEVDLSRAKRKKVLDASAAAYILQGALDAMQRI